MSRWPSIFLAVLAGSVAGCGASAAPAPKLVSAATRPVADGGPKATLKLGGNVERPLRLSEKTLSQLATRRVSLYEPFEQRRMTFRVVPLRDVLALAGVQTGAKTLHAVALNDYVVDLPLDVAAADGTYVAVSGSDGSAIPVESGGPIRIVFADDTKGGEVDNYWIWSLAQVTVQ